MSKKMSKRAETALLRSIEHWKAIVANKGIDDGAEDCALCDLYWGNNCKNCPVFTRTGQEMCEGSPFHAWLEYLDEEFKQTDEERTALAQAELTFLISLLPGEHND